MDDWDRLEAELLEDPATREAFDARRPAYEIASRLIEMRLSLELSQRQLAAKAHMTQPEIARIESGQVQPTWETLARVLSAVGASVDIKVHDKTGRLLKLTVAPGNKASPATRRGRSLQSRKAERPGDAAEEFGGPTGIRTQDQPVMSRPLSPLSYGPHRKHDTRKAGT